MNRYCTCQRISFGEMIACDNDDCPIEWFHYGCVGITEENRPKSELLRLLALPAAVNVWSGGGAITRAGWAVRLQWEKGCQRAAPH